MILYLPHTVRHPCFGDVIAWLRFWNLKVRHPREPGLYRHSRCKSCPVREACEWIVLQRSKLTPEIEDAFSAFRARGDRNFHSKEGGRIRNLIAERDDLDSFNDFLIRAYWSKREKAQKQTDATRKRKERRNAVKDGVVLPDYRQAAEAERDRRVDAVRAFVTSPDAPQAWRRLQEASCHFIGDTWLANQMLSWQLGKAPSDYAIATWLVEHGRSQGKAHAAMKQRVKADRARGAVLESQAFGGATASVWQRFDAHAAVDTLVANRAEA